MRWPEAAADPFPSQPRFEPEDLRRDILDELADHLALAVDREMTRVGHSEDKAWKQALARFGNPDALARRLWWDAMRERIMRDWIQTGIAVVSAIVIVLTAVFLAYSMRQMQTMQVMQTELLKTVKELGAGKTQESEGLSLDVEIRRGVPDGPPAAGLRVMLAGKLDGAETAEAVLDTNAEGRARFYPVPQGKYSLRVDDPQSTMVLRTTHSLFAGTGSTLQILAPDYAAADTRFVIKPELPFRDERVLVAASFSVEDKVGDFAWFREGTVLAGRAGVYADEDTVVPSRSHTQRGTSERLDFYGAPLGPPRDTAKIPPLRFAFEVHPVFLFEDRSRVAVIGRSGAGNDETRTTVEHMPGESDTVTFQLTEEQGIAAERVMETYSIASRWWRQDQNMESRYTDLSRIAADLNGYVVDALLLTDAVTVAPSTRSGTSMTLGVRENRRESDVVWGGDEKDKSAALRLPDAGKLLSSYPAGCRFVFSCIGIEDADITAWFGNEWSTEAGSSFTVSLGDGVQWRMADERAMRHPLTDVTRLIRGENKPGPVAGLLVQFETGRGLVLDGSGVDEKYYRPYLLVVSDSPPDDL